MAGIHYGGLLLCTLVILAAFFYRDSEDKKLKTILSALLRVENKFNLTSRPRIAVGFSGCVDIITDALPVFEALDTEPAEQAVHHGKLDNLDNVKETFAYFFTHGAAGERYVHNQHIFKALVKISKRMPGVRLHPGGYAVVSAVRFARLGCDVLLATELERKTIDALEPNIRLTGKPVATDDVHLVLEFKTGDRWGKFESKRANRFIVNHDVHGPYLKAIEQLEEEMGKFSPNLIAVGGFQMLDVFPFKSDEKKKRLERLSQYLSRNPKNVLHHLELGSFTDDIFFKDLIDQLLPYSDSMGMNEQELSNFHSILKYGNTSLISNSLPRVAAILDSIREVFTILDGSHLGKRVTRIHLHTLAFQAIFVRKTSPWKNTMVAAAKAALMANRHVCGSSKILPEKSTVFMDDSFSVSQEPGSERIKLQPDRPVSCWEEGDFQICVAPGLVCTDVYQTAGGGDNISAAALVVQI